MQKVRDPALKSSGQSIAEEFDNNRIAIESPTELKIIHLEDLLDAWASCWCEEHGVRLNYVAYNGYDKRPNPKHQVFKAEIQGDAGKKLESYVHWHKRDERFKHDEIPQLLLVEEPHTLSAGEELVSIKEIDSNVMLFTPDKVASLTSENKLVRMKDKVTYTDKYVKMKEIRTDTEIKCSFKIGGNVSGVGLEGGLEVALRRGVTTQTQHETGFSIDIDFPDDPTLVRVFSIKMAKRTYKVDCHLKGSVVIQCHGDISIPMRYGAQNQGVRNVFIIPISEIFIDLRKYHKEGSLPTHLAMSLQCFSYLADQTPVTTISMTELATTSPHLSTIKDKNMEAQFQRSIDDFNNKYRSACLGIATIERQFFDPIKLDGNYIPLEMVAAQNMSTRILFDDFVKLLISRKRVYLSADPGKGKTTFTTFFLNEWASCRNTLLNQFKWVFRISLGDLKKYVERNKDSPEKLMLHEVLRALVFPDIITNYTNAMFSTYQSLWYDELEAIITGDHTKSILKTEATKGLLILDGWDEMGQSSDRVAGPLRKLLLVLCSCPYSMIASRTYQANDLDAFGLKNLMSLRLLGFDSSGIKFYVNRYFENLPPRHMEPENNIVPESVQNKFDITIRQTPLLLELICLTWYNLGDKFQDQPDQSKFSANLYDQILLFCCLRYIKKFGTVESANIVKLSEDDILDTCKEDIAVMEHFAFDFFRRHVKELSVQDSRKYLCQIVGVEPKDISAHYDVMRLRRFGFVLPEGSANHSIASSETYKFTHDAFVRYFAARFLVSCLRKEVRNDQTHDQPQYGLLNHNWSKCQFTDSTVVYLSKHHDDEELKPVIELMRQIFENLPDTVAEKQDCLRKLPERKKSEVAVGLQQEIHLHSLETSLKPALAKGGKFKLERLNAKTLKISCEVQVSSKLSENLRMLAFLEKSIREDLEAKNGLDFKINYVEDNGLVFLTIESGSIESMDELCATLPKPYTSEQAVTFLKFFKWPSSSKEQLAQKAEKVIDSESKDQEASSISCPVQ